MRIKIVTLFLMFFCVSLSKAQNILPFLHQTDTIRKHDVRFMGGNYLHGTALPNSFSDHFLDGSKIDTSEISDINDRMKRNGNRAGVELDYEFEYRYGGRLFKKYPEWGLLFKAGMHTVGGGSYSRDLFNLVFRGNSPYAGQTLELGPASLVTTTYQTVGLGLYSKEKNVSVALSYVNGQSLLDFTLNKGDFYTDSLGQYISLEHDAVMIRSDSSRNGFGKSNGWGFCADVFFTFKIDLDSTFSDFSEWFVQFNNIGFIQWNKNTLTYQKDSSLYYQGFAVNNILDPGQNFLGGETDVTDTFKVKYEKQRWTQILPGHVIIGNYVNPLSGTRFKPMVGLRYRFIENYKPLFYAGFSWRMWTTTYLATQVHLGGFGNWRMAMRLSLPFLFKGRLVIGSSHLTGLFDRNACGRDLYAGVQIRF